MFSNTLLSNDFIWTKKYKNVKKFPGIVIAAEHIKPVITGCEMKFTINPSLSKPTIIRIKPAKKLKVTAIFGSEVISAGV